MGHVVVNGGALGFGRDSPVLCALNDVWAQTFFRFT